MKSTPSQSVVGGKAHLTNFSKVLDGRKRPVRGLWKRNGRFYAQLALTEPATGRKSVRRVPLVDRETAQAVTTVPQAIAALERLKVKRTDGDLPVLRRCPKFDEYARTYLAAPSDHKPGTVAKEKSTLKGWIEHLGGTRLNQITKPMVIAYRDQRLKSGMSHRTCNIDLIALRNVLKRAIDEEWILKLPTAGLRPLKVEKSKRNLTTAEQIEKVCQAAFSLKLKNAQQFADYIRLMAALGSRRNETLRLRWADVDFQRRQITIRGTKNGEDRVADFNPKLETHLTDMFKRRAPDSQWLFPSPQRGEQDIPALTFRESLLRARLAAELPHFGFHDCRHHFASYGVMSGIDYMTLAAWLGHKDGGILIGKTYGHLANEHKRAMAEKLNFGPAGTAK
jgi:integrase